MKYFIKNFNKFFSFLLCNNYVGLETSEVNAIIILFKKLHAIVFVIVIKMLSE